MKLRCIKITFSTLQPTVFGVKCSLENVEGLFPIELSNFKLWEMSKLLNFRFPERRYFFNFNNTELKKIL